MSPKILSSVVLALAASTVGGQEIAFLTPTWVDEPSVEQEYSQWDVNDIESHSLSCSLGGMIPDDESPLWTRLPGEWRPLWGELERDGYAIEWHDIPGEIAFDWAEGMRPGCVEFCLNLEGEVELGGRKAKEPLSAGGATLISVHYRSAGALKATRVKGKRHRFLSVSITTEHLRGLTSEHRGFSIR